MIWRSGALLLLTLAPVLSSLAVASQADDPCQAPRIRTAQRPGAGGAPTEVSIGVRMVDLTDINDVDQTLTGDFAVFLQWTDPRLEGLDGCRIPLDRVWTPGIRFANSGRLFTSEPREVRIGPAGAVTYLQRYYGSMATYHNLRKFPFDEQTFVLILVSLELGEQDVVLSVNERATGRRNLLNISAWTVTSVDAVVQPLFIEATGNTASAYHLRISANRERVFYVWKIIVPLCLIVFMSWTVFWINPGQFGPQIGLSATSMLTLIAFQFATTNMVPALGYFTTLDEFITGSTILVFLALVQSLATSFLVSQDKQALGLQIDRISRYVFPVIFAILVLLVFFR